MYVYLEFLADTIPTLAKSCWYNWLPNLRIETLKQSF